MIGRIFVLVPIAVFMMIGGVLLGGDIGGRLLITGIIVLSTVVMLAAVADWARERLGMDCNGGGDT